MESKKTFVRIVAIILAILLAGSVLVGIITSTRASAVSKSDVTALQKQQDEIKQKMQDLKSQINSLKYDQSAATAKKEVLDEQVALTQEEIDNITKQIAEYDDMIAQKETEVGEAQKAEASQWDTYKIRMRVMEEGGTISYFAIIFEANSFSDMLDRIDKVFEIMQSDESMYQNLVESRKATEEAKVSLEQAQEDQKTKKSELSQSEAQLKDQVSQAAELVSQIEGNIDSYNTLYDQTAAEEDKVKDKITEMEAALKKQEEEAAAKAAAAKAAAEAAGRTNTSGGSSGSYSGGSVKGTGSFVWPSADSRLITSFFGTRYHPVYHTYKTHNGIDIGASYGTNILAADGGTVITSEYSSSYGNYVVISHGNGYTTLYGHMSKRLVSSGDRVSQGQVIGLIGSTGVSTGPHLHFEIWKNGSRVNPLDYFSNYTVSSSAY